jgi:hypothetical protein
MGLSGSEASKTEGSSSGMQPLLPRSVKLNESMDSCIRFPTNGNTLSVWGNLLKSNCSSLIDLAKILPLLS